MYARSGPFLVDALARARVRLPPLGLVDVGVSGGIYPIWRSWGDRLRAVGFDPSVRDVEALQRAERAPDVSYECAFVEGPSGSRPVGPARPVGAVPSTYPLHRTSAYAAAEILEGVAPEQWWRNPETGPMDAAFSGTDPDTDPFYRHHARRMGESGAPELTDRRTTLDAHFAADAEPAQFLKVDTDGHELDVLRGSARLFDAGWFDFVEVECQFHGPATPDANTFPNVDAFLRERHFALYRMDPHSYSRRALPYPFEHRIAAQTTRGPLQWADVLYVRDPLGPYGGEVERTPERLLAMALVFDLYELCDCAAEILIECRDRLLLSDVEWEEALDFLTRKVRPRSKSFRAFTARFARDPLRS